MLDMDFDVEDLDDSKKDLKSMLPRLARRINQKQDSTSSPASARSTPRLGSEERIISVFNPAQRSPSGSFKNNNNSSGIDDFVEPRPARRRHTRKSQTGSICYAAADLPPEIKSMRNQDIYNEPDSAADRALHAVSQMLNNNNNNNDSSNNNDNSYYDNNVDYQQSASLSASQQATQRVEGRIVQQDHAQYALTYGMMLGIRVTTGRRELSGTQRASSLSSAPNRDSSFSNNVNNSYSNNSYSGSNHNLNSLNSANLMVEEERELLPEDFAVTTKLLFLPEGNTSGPFPTPPHRLPFAFGFKDYTPSVFRALRGLNNVDEADYMTSLAGDFNYIEFLANSKSGQFFFYSHDGRFMIKTQTREEAKLLREMLPSYVKHLVDHPDSLLARFYGLHRVEMPTLKRRTFFVVMQSVFYCPLDKPLTLHVKYDLKGSTIGRRTDDTDCLEGAVQKDLNFTEQQRKICLGKDRILIFAETLRADTNYLKELRIMDYSLLIGIHDPQEEERLSNSQIKQQRRRSSGGVILAKRKASIVRFDHEEAAAHCWQSPSIFNSYCGGIKSAATQVGSHSHPEVYFMGIIDILQVYNTNKRLENFFKGFSYDRKQLSAVDPSLYAERMVNFLLANSDFGDAIKASKLSAKQPELNARRNTTQLNNATNDTVNNTNNNNNDNMNNNDGGRQRTVSSPQAYKNNNTYNRNNNNNYNNQSNNTMNFYNNNDNSNVNNYIRSRNNNNNSSNCYNNNNSNSDKNRDRYKLL